MNAVEEKSNVPTRAELESRLLEVYRQLHLIDNAHNRLVELYLFLHNSINH